MNDNGSTPDPKVKFTVEVLFTQEENVEFRELLFTEGLSDGSNEGTLLFLQNAVQSAILGARGIEQE